MKKISYAAIRLVGTFFTCVMLCVILLSSSFSSHAASPKISLSSASSTDPNGYYVVKLSMSDISISAKKSVDVKLIYNNLSFTVAKTVFSNSVKNYAKVDETSDYHIKITAGNSTLKHSGAVCTIYFEPIGVPSVGDYNINLEVSGVTASVESGKIQVTCPHSYVDKNVVSPTCTSEGYTLEQCTKCDGYRRNDKTEPLGHSYKDVGKIEPDCTHPGATVQECTRCHLSNLVEDEEPLGHEYGIADFIIVEPTCSQQGYTEFACLREGCDGAKRQDYTDMVDHEPGEPVITKASCQKAGSENVYCKHCEILMSEKTLAVVPHIFEDTKVEPTCTSRGYTRRICVACGTVRRETPIEMIAHSYNVVIEREATCAQSGRKKYICPCGDSYTEEIPALEHNYVKSSVINATDESDGMIHYVCLSCSDEHDEIVPAGSTSSESNVGGWTSSLDVHISKPIIKLSESAELLIKVMLIVCAVLLLALVIMLVKKVFTAIFRKKHRVK